MYAILDVETTGGNALHDKITEIAIYLHDGKTIVDEFTSLINPECNIPYYITRLTGIDNEMVKAAPKFYEIAKDIIRFTEGTTIVAHNALFDYSFITSEYKSLGYSFSRDYLCTVRLSRKLIPGYRSYSLGNLCESLNIPLKNRHRAGGDALATVKLFELLISRDPDKKLINSLVRNDHVHLRFPPEFDRTILDKLPESAGVYYFYNQDNNIIYIGKSNNIKKRVLMHFSNKQTRKAIELRNSIRDITFEVTGSELVALLLESDEIKKRQPLFNRAQKNSICNYAITYQMNEKGYLTLSAERVRGGVNQIYLTKTHEEARSLLENLSEEHNLCQKLTGLYDISHACFQYSVNRCNGACIGKEDPEQYNTRVEKALRSLDYKNTNFMIIGSGRTEGEKSVVMVEDGKYLGFGFFDPDFIGQSIESLRDSVVSRQDNRDVHRIIKGFLNSHTNKTVLTY